MDDVEKWLALDDEVNGEIATLTQKCSICLGTVVEFLAQQWCSLCV